MEDIKTLVIKDENGISKTLELLTILQIDEIKYAVYSVDINMNTSDIYALKIIKDKDNNDIVVEIVDEVERNKVFNVIDRMINES